LASKKSGGWQEKLDASEEAVKKTREQLRLLDPTIIARASRPLADLYQVQGEVERKGATSKWMETEVKDKDAEEDGDQHAGEGIVHEALDDAARFAETLDTKHVGASIWDKKVQRTSPSEPAKA